MSIRNLTELNNLVLRCENSLESFGWYNPTTKDITSTSPVSDDFVNSFYYEKRNNVIMINGSFFCKTLGDDVKLTFNLPENYIWPGLDWNGIGNALTYDTPNTGNKPLFLNIVEINVLDKNELNIIFVNPLRVLDTQLVSKTYNFNIYLSL